MKKTKIIYSVLVILFGILIFAGYYTYKKQSLNQLPPNFTALLDQDSTSSGGSRYTFAKLVFTNNFLTEGTLTYTYSRQTITKTTCTYKNNIWISEDESLCTINFIPIPITKNNFQKLIRDNKIKPLGNLCQHLDVCFTIKD